MAHTIYTLHFPICKAKEINLLLCEVQVLKFSYENPNIYEMVSLVPGIFITTNPAYCHSDIPLCAYLSYRPTHEVSKREMQDFGHIFLPPECGCILIWPGHFICMIPSPSEPQHKARLSLCLTAYFIPISSFLINIMKNAVVAVLSKILYK